MLLQLVSASYWCYLEVHQDCLSKLMSSTRKIFRQAIDFVFLMFLVLLAPVGNAAAQESRVALVIGNAAYDHVSKLANPVNDATDIANALERIGFEVSRGMDLDFRGMRLALRDFARKAIDADVVIVYFAGHGIEIDNTNYLIPTNAELASDQDVEFEALRLDAVVAAVANVKGLKVILVDACRNNPFLRDMTRTSATRSIGRGLGRINPGGVLVGYAARGGTLALDGAGRNSPYAQALLSHIEEPGLELGKMFRKVRDKVFDLTDGYQEPFTYGSLPGKDIFLVPALPAVSDRDDGEKIARDFERADQLASVDAWNSFLETYADRSDHPLTRLARRKRDETLLNPGSEKGLVESEPQISLPEWCGNPNEAAQQLICETEEFIVAEARIARLYRSRLDYLRGGDVYGQVILDHAAFGDARTACGADPQCLRPLYSRHSLALMGLPAGLTPDQQVVYQVQTELNRLSCGGGEPDGLTGALTRAAINRVSTRSAGTMASGSLANSVETLAKLRALPDGLCSVLTRAKTEPTLLTGTWRLTTTCPKGSQWAEGTSIARVVIRHEGERSYRAEFGALPFAYPAEFAGKLTHEPKLTFTWTNPDTSWRVIYVFEPGDDPSAIKGQSTYRCEETLSRQ